MVRHDSDVCGTTSQNREENRAAAALPGQRMMALGLGGVAAATARGWSISSQLSVVEILLAVMVTMMGDVTEMSGSRGWRRGQNFLAAIGTWKVS
eukprot:scaffold112593_cov56-Cyclotella_meneghiniana.AAC.2